MRNKYLLALIASLGLSTVIAKPTLATVSIVNGPTSLITSPIMLNASSSPTGLFSFTISQSSGETLSSVSVSINNNSTSVMPGSHLASVSVYRDNGDNVFNSTTDALVGSQSIVNIGTPTVITATSNNTITGSTEFFVAVSTAASWTDSSPADSFTATFPANSIATSSNSPTVTPVTTSNITADVTGPMLTSVVAQNTGGTVNKEAGDSLVFTFSSPTNTPSITAANISNLFLLNNSHSLLDGSGQIGSATWNTGGTTLTLTLSGAGTTTPATVNVGDTVTIASPSIITDALGNKASGTVTITGDFGSTQNRPGNTVCSNGLIQGNLYTVQGSSAVYISVGCQLKLLGNSTTQLSSLNGYTVITPGNHKEDNNENDRENHGNKVNKPKHGKRLGNAWGRIFNQTGEGRGRGHKKD